MALPIAARLVPPVAATVPEGFVRVEERLAAGVPHRIRLDAELELVVLVPTGLARVWIDADPDAVVATSGPERAPWSPAEAPVGACDRAPVRLVVMDTGIPVATVPLTAGLRRLVPDAGAGHAAKLELLVLDWELRAGALRGPGETASRVVLAWRRADAAVDQLSIPPPPRPVARRLPSVDRLDSHPGPRPIERETWFMRLGELEAHRSTLALWRIPQ